MAIFAAPSMVLGAESAGEKLFAKDCQRCHEVKSDMSSAGPSLQGVIGRKAGTLSNWEYSATMKSSGTVWTEAALEQWLSDPHGKVPETAMPFAGIKSDADRKALIAYLKQFSKK